MSHDQEVAPKISLEDVQQLQSLLDRIGRASPEELATVLPEDLQLLQSAREARLAMLSARLRQLVTTNCSISGSCEYENGDDGGQYARWTITLTDGRGQQVDLDSAIECEVHDDHPGVAFVACHVPPSAEDLEQAGERLSAVHDVASALLGLQGEDHVEEIRSLNRRLTAAVPTVEMSAP